MTFEVNEEMKQWAKEHFGSIGIGGIWSPDGAGLTYQKVDENTWKLVKRMNHPDVMENHARFATLMMSVGINMAEGEQVDYEPPTNPEQAYIMEQQHKMEIAQTWTHDCGKRICEMDLEKAVAHFVSDQEVLLETGDTDTVEVWAYRLQCPECDGEINMDPDDYHLLAGDDLFMQFVDSDGTILRAMTRRQMIDTADTNELGVLVGTSSPNTGAKVPPWMWGTYCRIIGDEEE
jgi:hypothetical protein|tara:strand:- start:174 stop:872 length:699 start_codon:yes stop_codon:yes gene_type:complete